LNLAPTASTTAALGVGDALAVALLQARGFTEEDFARSHPAGQLGRRLLLHVKDVMRTGKDVPKVFADTPLSAGLLEVTRKGLGMTAVVDADDRVIGIFTDGDLRRALDRAADVRTTAMHELMTRHAKTFRRRCSQPKQSISWRNFGSPPCWSSTPTIASSAHSTSTI
jgi:arabinose-5-phosphate isomerase